MIISISEFNDNISYYIDLAKKEPIKLTKRGIVVAVIISKKTFDRCIDVRFESNVLEL